MFDSCWFDKDCICCNTVVFLYILPRRCENTKCSSFCVWLNSFNMISSNSNHFTTDDRLTFFLSIYLDSIPVCVNTYVSHFLYLFIWWWFHSLALVNSAGPNMVEQVSLTIIYLFYLKDWELEKRNLLAFGSLLKCSQQLGLGQTKTRNQEFSLSFPRAF